MTVAAGPHWAEWAPAGALPEGTVGIEEEVMLLDPDGWTLASRVDSVLRAAGPRLGGHLSQETHGSAVELATSPHRHVADAVESLTELRAALAETVDPIGLRLACAGTHPFASWHDVEVSAGARQQAVYAAMRELARREPTFALHVHVAVEDPDAAVRAMNRMRAHVPLLVALSGNSPYWAGRDSGLACTRLTVFDGFPRTGLPRAFGSYDELVGATDGLIATGAIQDPSFLWWDVRLQPRLGTLELRVMDAQADPDETAALAALVQALVAREAEPEGWAPDALVHAPEVLAENRFLASRDGLDAELVDPVAGRLVPAREVLARTLDAVGEHGGDHAREGLAALAAQPGAARQRAVARREGSLQAVVADLAAGFA